MLQQLLALPYHTYSKFSFTYQVNEHIDNSTVINFECNKTTVARMAAIIAAKDATKQMEIQVQELTGGSSNIDTCHWLKCHIFCDINFQKIPKFESILDHLTSNYNVEPCPEVTAANIDAQCSAVTCS